VFATAWPGLLAGPAATGLLGGGKAGTGGGDWGNGCETGGLTATGGAGGGWAGFAATGSGWAFGAGAGLGLEAGMGSEAISLSPLPKSANSPGVIVGPLVLGPGLEWRAGSRRGVKRSA